MSNKWIGWIDKSNAEQCQWALAYLHNSKTYHQIPKAQDHANHSAPLRDSVVYTLQHKASNAYSLLVQATQNFIDTAEAREFKKNMRGAWRAKQYRDRHNGYKACNLMLATSSISKLNNMAKENNRPKNKLLDQLINNSDIAIEEIRENYQKKLKAKKDAFDKQKNVKITEAAMAKLSEKDLKKYRQNSPLLFIDYIEKSKRVESLELKITNLKNELDKKKNTSNKYLREICLYEKLSKINKISLSDLSTQQEDSAFRLYKKKLDLRSD